MTAAKIEKLDLSFSINELQEYLNKLIQKLTPLVRGNCYNGWSLLSDNGDWQSGFHEGSKAFNQKGEFDKKHWNDEGYIFDTHFNKPTQACFGYGEQIIKELQRLGFYPRRARVLGLLPGQTTKWHRDHLPEAYWIRLHIPIQTNNYSMIKTDSDSYHLPADGSVYLFDTSCLHKAENLGLTIRYHFVVQVWDTKHLSKNFHYHLPEISNFVLKTSNRPTLY